MQMMQKLRVKKLKRRRQRSERRSVNIKRHIRNTIRVVLIRVLILIRGRGIARVGKMII